MQIQIQKINSKDIPLVNRILQTEFSYLDLTKHPLEEKIKNPRYFLWKITCDQKLAGFIELETLPEPEQSIRINGLSVLPEYRNLGLAQQLLSFALKEMKKKEFETAYLLVSKKNAVAQKIYSNAGFAFAYLWVEKIRGEEIEVWSKPLQTEHPKGVH